MSSDNQTSTVLSIPTDAPSLVPVGKKCLCYVKSVYDGDTITIIFPFNGNFYKESCRIYGIDTPEIRTKDLSEKERGMNAKHHVESLILNKNVYVDFMGREKYGRILAKVYMCDEDCTELSELLIKGGYGCVYYGGKKGE